MCWATYCWVKWLAAYYYTWHMLHLFFPLLLAPLVQRVCRSCEQFSLLTDWGLSFILIHITCNCCRAICRHALLCQSQQEPAVWWRLTFSSATWWSESGTICTERSVWARWESPSGRVCSLQQTVSCIKPVHNISPSPLFHPSLFNHLLGVCFLFHTLRTCVPQRVH